MIVRLPTNGPTHKLALSLLKTAKKPFQIKRVRNCIGSTGGGYGVNLYHHIAGGGDIGGSGGGSGSGSGGGGGAHQYSCQTQLSVFS